MLSKAKIKSNIDNKNHPRKICMVAYTNYLSDARPRREAEALVERGDKVDFIALKEKSANTIKVMNGVRLIQTSLARYRGENSFQYILSYCVFFIIAFYKVTLLHFQCRYDVVYIHTMPDFMVFVGTIPKIFGAKIVLNIHDMMPELYMSKFGCSEKNFIIRLLAMQEKLSCGFADKVICVHHPHKDCLVKRGINNKKITILMNLPDPKLFDHNGKNLSEKKDFRIVYHGTVAGRLGLDLAIEAFRKVVDKYPHAKFDILGDGDASRTIEEKIHDFELGRNIYFSKSFFRVDDIPALVEGATAGIVPSRKNLATEYMLPVKLLEYVYLNIPVIAPRLLTIQYYFPESSIAYYRAGSIDELATRIIQLYEYPEERDRLRENASKFFNEFNWDSMKKDLYSLID